MYEAVKGIIYLCVVFRLVTGHWPDLTDPDAQRAVEETLWNASQSNGV